MPTPLERGSDQSSTVNTWMVLVLPVVSLIPAVTTTSSPTLMQPISRPWRIANRTIASSERSPSKRIAVIPQFIESLRRTSGETETARIGQAGRYFDIARAARGADTVIIKEFKGVTVRDYLEITLKPSRPGGAPPVLCGVEATAAGW